MDGVDEVVLEQLGAHKRVTAAVNHHVHLTANVGGLQPEVQLYTRHNIGRYKVIVDTIVNMTSVKVIRKLINPCYMHVHDKTVASNIIR